MTKEKSLKELYEKHKEIMDDTDVLAISNWKQKNNDEKTDNVAFVENAKAKLDILKEKYIEAVDELV